MSNITELELGPVIDSSGAEVSEQDIIARAEAVEKIEFTDNGLTYAALIRRSQISARLVNREAAIQAGFYLQAGFKSGEDVKEDDPRIGKVLEIAENSEALEQVQADITVEATVIENGKPQTNAPQLLAKKFDRAALLKTGTLGNAYIKAVMAALRPTSGGAESGAEAAPKTKTASITAS